LIERKVVTKNAKHHRMVIWFDSDPK
jgi:hypothetical protein